MHLLTPWAHWCATEVQDLKELGAYRVSLEESVSAALEALSARRQMEGRSGGALDEATTALLEACTALGEQALALCTL